MKNPNYIQKRFPTEAEARAFARTLGRAYTTIILSKEKGYRDEPGVDNPWLYWVESGDSSCSFVRSWESLVFDGEGRRA